MGMKVIQTWAPSGNIAADMLHSPTDERVSLVEQSVDHVREDKNMMAADTQAPFDELVDGDDGDLFCWMLR